MGNQTPRSPSLTHCMSSNISISRSVQQTLRTSTLLLGCATVVLLHENRGCAEQGCDTLNSKACKWHSLHMSFRCVVWIKGLSWFHILLKSIKTRHGKRERTPRATWFESALYSSKVEHFDVASNSRLNNQFDNKPMLHTCKMVLFSYPLCELMCVF